MFQLLPDVSIVRNLILPTQRFLMKAFSPVSNLVGRKCVPLRQLTREDFLDPSLSGKRLVIMAASHSRPIYEGVFLNTIVEPPPDEYSDGCNYVVGATDKKVRELDSQFKSDWSIASEWGDGTISFDLDKLVGGKYRCYSV